MVEGIEEGSQRLRTPIPIESRAFLQLPRARAAVGGDCNALLPGGLWKVGREPAREGTRSLRDEAPTLSLLRWALEQEQEGALARAAS